MKTEWVEMVAEQLKQSAVRHAQQDGLIVDIRDRVARIEQDLLHLREQTRAQDQTLQRIAEAASPSQLKDLVATVQKHEQTLARIMVAAVVAQLLFAPIVAGLVSVYMQPKKAAVTAPAPAKGARP